MTIAEEILALSLTLSVLMNLAFIAVLTKRRNPPPPSLPREIELPLVRKRPYRASA